MFVAKFVMVMQGRIHLLYLTPDFCLFHQLGFWFQPLLLSHLIICIIHLIILLHCRFHIILPDVSHISGCHVSLHNFDPFAVLLTCRYIYTSVCIMYFLLVQLIPFGSNTRDSVPSALSYSPVRQSRCFTVA